MNQYRIIGSCGLKAFMVDCQYLWSGLDAGSEINLFLGRRSLATEIFFFQSAERKMQSPKNVNKIFPWQQNTKQNFSFKNQNEENAFGAAMATSPLMIKLNTNMPIIYPPATEKPRRMNQMQFRATAKCFRSTLNLLLSLPFGEEMYPTEKLPFDSLL